MTLTTAPPGARPDLPPPGLRSTRAGLSDRAFRALSLGAGLTVFAVLGLIAISTTREAWPAFRADGLSFFTTSRWAPNVDVFGSLAFVFGTVLVSVIALVFAVPVSMGIALFISEVAPRRLRRLAGSFVDLLAAVPSVVYGLWGILVFAPFVVKVYEPISEATEPIPVLGWIFGPPVNGFSFATAGIILALMITPIITAITREVFDTVPASQKEAAYALGSTRWEMIRASIFPYSRAGIVGAVLLGLGRAMGETIAVALVIGSSPTITSHIFRPGDAMAAVIANQFGEAGGLHRSALIALGVELFVITIIVNIVARAIVHRRAGA
ncbi:MAG: phosphate ABC transporter permease subunit PstC [Acidimicrobiales bacterium]